MKIRSRTFLMYIVALIVFAAFAAFIWWAQANVSPQLGVFFGFIFGYAVAVIVIFYLLRGYGA
jgi:uncharacterized membrane protein